MRDLMRVLVPLLFCGVADALELKTLLYDVFAEGVWLAIGAISGAGGIFAGMICTPKMEDPSASGVWVFFAMFAMLLGVVVSGVCAAICLASGLTFDVRVKVMTIINIFIFLPGFIWSVSMGTAAAASESKRSKSR